MTRYLPIMLLLCNLILVLYVVANVHHLSGENVMIAWTIYVWLKLAAEHFETKER